MGSFFTKNVIKSLEHIPKVDLVIAPYILPFFTDFNAIWEKIVQSIKPNGYFIGTFFADNPIPKKLRITAKGKNLYSTSWI